MSFTSSLEALNFLIGQADAGAAQSPMGGLMSMAPLMIAFIFIMYFLTIRPQQKRDRERQEMLNALSKGDKIVTTGGICGKVVGLRETEVDVLVGKDVTIKFLRSSIAQIIKSNGESKD
tara:strand:+ start:24 stop:380 length:357 start_codon:yes stop_codon:yes gene_type:complete